MNDWFQNINFTPNEIYDDNACITESYQLEEMDTPKLDFGYATVGHEQPLFVLDDPEFELDMDYTNPFFDMKPLHEAPQESTMVKTTTAVTDSQAQKPEIDEPKVVPHAENETTEKLSALAKPDKFILSV